MKKFLIGGVLLLSLVSLVGCGYEVKVVEKTDTIEVSPYEKTNIKESIDGFNDTYIYRNRINNLAYRVVVYKSNCMSVEPVLGPDKQPVTVDEYKELIGIK